VKWFYIIGIVFLVGCTTVVDTDKEVDKMEVKLSGITKDATIAGGCFWCIESAFEGIPGIISAVSGYSGGSVDNPTYKQVTGGKTGHYEAVRLVFDPTIITYKEILEYFFGQIDATDADGQFADRGPQYKTAIFYHDLEQKKDAEFVIKGLTDKKVFDGPIVTEVVPIKNWYEAEEYHQDYSQKNSVRYNSYKKASGRSGFIDKMEKKSEEELKERLTPLQYKVTQESGTEPAFNNEYWDNKKEGIYVDIVTGDVLFSSVDKYKSGTGWPSFTKTVSGAKVIEVSDNTLGMKRTEVRTKSSHLGHIFNDGPNGGPRYCINSASLKFISKEKLVEEGYEEFSEIFG